MTQSGSTRLTPRPGGGSATSDDLSVFLARHHAAIVILTGPRKGSELPLHRPRVVIGRSQDADLVFADDTMSREHAMIGFRDGCFFVQDLESSNGTHVNGERVDVADLEHGDRIRMGSIEVQVLIDEREPTPTTHVIDVD